MSSHLQIIAELETVTEIQAKPSVFWQRGWQNWATRRPGGTRSRKPIRHTVRPSAEPIGWADTQEDEGMYIDADFIIKAASLLSALGALVAAVVAVYKVLENNKKQNEFINAMQEEQTLICYGLRGALQGLVEQGCNGPCKDALARLDKHLNKSAHPHIPEG